MREIDRGSDFDRLEKAELLSIHTLDVADHQPFRENAAHAAGDDAVTDLDIFLAQDEIEDQLISLAAANAPGTIFLEQAGDSRGSVGNQQDP